MTETPRIVVGVDGSPNAMNALEFAIEETKLRHGRLNVTHAYAVRPVSGSTGKDDYDQVEADARTFVEDIKSSATSTDGIDIEWLAVPGNPAEVLIEASSGAALLIVGSRGIGGFEGLMMGSVSTQCVHHAHCSVLVVREDH